MNKLLVALALLLPAQAAAQTGSTFTPYLATDGSVSGMPFLMGANYAREYGWMALRLGGVVDAGSAFGAEAPEGASRLGVFGADLDALLYAGSPASVDARVVPYVVAGVGMQALSGAVSSSFATSYSLGVGGRMPLSSWFALDGEARYRQPIEAGILSVPEEIGNGLEFRFGISVRASGRQPRVRVPPPSVLVSRPSLSTYGSAGSAATRSSAGSSTAAAARLRVAERTLNSANEHLGVRYTWGGNTPQEGFDCSGFVRYVYARNGVSLPRVSRDQARAGEALPLDLAVFEPGDLLAFASRRGGTVDHIAIYMGNGRIIHSSASGRGVRVDDLYSSRGRWYLDHMVAARRVIDPMTGFDFGRS